MTDLNRDEDKKKKKKKKKKNQNTLLKKNEIFNSTKFFVLLYPYSNSHNLWINKDGMKF